MEHNIKNYHKHKQFLFASNPFLYISDSMETCCLKYKIQFVNFLIIPMFIFKVRWRPVAWGIDIQFVNPLIIPIFIFKVRWRPVAWGIAIQFVLALIILRTQWGYDAFKWVGDRITEFLDYTDAGSKFVFGEAFMHHFFAFKV